MSDEGLYGPSGYIHQGAVAATEAIKQCAKKEAAFDLLLDAVRDAIEFLDRPDITTYEWYKLAPEHVGKFRRAIAAAEGEINE